MIFAPELRQNRFRTRLGTVLLALLCAWLAGCAGMARGTSNPVYRTAAPAASAETLAPGSETQIVIRYPAIIQAEAEHAFYQAFGGRAIGGNPPIEVMLRTDMTRVAQAMVAKSNYFAMSLYRELRDALPQYAVLLSPHMITWDRENGLGSRPLLASEQIPSVLTVDFNVYSYPDIREIMEAPPLTFGDIVTPLIVVHGNRWMRPATHGLLLASDPLLQSSWQLSRIDAERERAAILDYPAPDHRRPLDFAGFLAARDLQARTLPGKVAGEFQPDDLAVEVYPLEKVRMDPGQIAELADTPGADPFADSFVKGVAGRIVRLLHEVDHGRALFLQRLTALRRFDPELAAVYLTRSDDESLRARLQLAEALIQAEKAFLSDQSDKVFRGAWDGDYGEKMRQMITAEYGMLQERRRLSRIQNVTTALAIAMLAGSIYGTSVSGSAVASALQSITPVLVLGSIWSARSSFRTSARAANITEKFMALMAPELEQQIDVQVEWMESREKITARGFAEFRDKTAALYQSRVRSLDVTTDEHCAFHHPAHATAGRWFGRCSDGLATGWGYGVVRDGAGNAVEYLGEAERGLAAGIGGLIEQRADAVGATFYEGRFRGGLPDGVVAVQRPGDKSRLLRYTAGTETGRATEKEWVRPQF